jgi:transposase
MACLGDRGYDADWYREALQEKGTPFAFRIESRTKPIKYDKRRYTSRNRIEIIFRRLKDWRRVTTRYDRCLTGSALHGSQHTGGEALTNAPLQGGKYVPQS